MIKAQLKELRRYNTNNRNTKTMSKLQLVIAIAGKLYPIISRIVDDVQKAKNPSSEGGARVTKEERQEIIFSNIIQAVPVIEEIVKDL
jgi:hypothetical protein